MEMYEEDGKWYHGSPFKLKVLREGSTITQKRDLARIFSHKPEIVSIEDSGRILHNGVRPGFLYEISETITSEDVVPHPRTTMQLGYEWIISRPLQVKLLCETTPRSEELLTKAYIAELKRQTR